MRVVYATADLSTMRPSDKPDFVLAKGLEPNFGAEVTDLYQTESNARLVNLPNYMNDLWAGGRLRHKDDVEELQVIRATITDKDGNVKQTDVPGILQKSPPVKLKYERLAAILRDKNEKCAGYRQDLSHINLIIVDHFQMPSDLEGEYNTGDLFSCGVREALADSPFQEIYLVGRSPEGSFFYRPLRLLLMLEQFYVLGSAIETFDRELDLSRQDLAPLFVRVMADSPLGVRYAIERERELAVIDCCGVRVAEDGRVEVLDFADLPVPEVAPLPDTSMSVADLRALRVHHRDVGSGNGLTTSLRMPSASERPWGDQPPE
jgi:hypothetical protein